MRIDRTVARRATLNRLRRPPVTQPVSPDHRTGTPIQDRGRAPGRQPANGEAGVAPGTTAADGVRLTEGAAALRDVLATRPSGHVRTAEAAAGLATRVSEQLRQDPAAALLAFGAARGATVRSLLATA
jgi:hypothetical protein